VKVKVSPQVLRQIARQASDRKGRRGRKYTRLLKLAVTYYDGNVAEALKGEGSLPKLPE
jgi:hypothetical protein